MIFFIVNIIIKVIIYIYWTDASLSLKCVYLLDRNVKFGKCSKFQTQDAYQKALTKSAVPDQNASEISILTEFVESSAVTCKQCFIRNQKVKSVQNGKFTALRFTKSS